MKRIMIVGGPGSGKSTLARMLGERLNLPVFHMDQIHWKENWIERPLAEKLPMALAVEAHQSWIFEGGMSRTYESRAARAEVLIWLDFPVGLRLWRVTKRLFRNLGKAEGRADLPKGCVERIHPQTLAFYRYIWTSRHPSHAKIAQLLMNVRGDLKVVHLRSPRHVRFWLLSLTDET